MILVLVLASPIPVRAELDCGTCFSGKTIRWIVPNAPGGGYDTYSRLIEPFYEKELGAQIVVENLSGAGGITAAQTLARAASDGLSLGILNSPGLLVTALSGEVAAPHPANDFTILARVARSEHVWAPGGDSQLRSIEAVIQTGEARQLVFGMRGDVDLVVYSYESIRAPIVSGDLVPVLQISDSALSADPELASVALLGGEDGVAARRAAARGVGGEEVIADAAAVSAIGAGRLIAAPRVLPADVFGCLEEGLHRVLMDPEFRAAAVQARQSLDAARSDEAMPELRATVERVEKFLPNLQEAVRRSRR